MKEEIWEKHKILHHYTTLGGLKGIIENNSLWATNYLYLNDKSELEIAKQILIEKLLPKAIQECSDAKRIKDHPKKNLIIEERVRRYVSASYYTSGNNFFITSFCGLHDREYDEKNGLLSQWRGYGGQQGYRLTFDTTKLWKIIDKNASEYALSYGGLGNVIYSDNLTKIEEELTEAFNIVKNECFEVIKSDLDGLGLPKGGENEKLYESFIQIITRIKHEGFAEENEIRFVTHPYIGEEYVTANKRHKKIKGKKIAPEKKIYIRNNYAGNPVPYIEIIAASKSLLPIQEILIGPGHHKEQNANALKLWLSGFDDERSKIGINISKTPFVG